MGFNKLAGDQLPAAELNSFYSSAGLYAASITGTDAYAISVTPVPNDYDAGDTYTFKADVANTGAATLNVNSLGAKTIKKFGTLDLDTGDISAGQIVTVKYDGTYFQMESAARPVPFYQQVIPVDNDGNITGSMIFGSNPTGSVIYVHDSVNGTDKLRRFSRDSLTGAYLRTHEVTVTEPGGGWNFGGIVEVGSYIYLICDTTNANMEGFRFLAADLTGQTTMTLPAVASSNSPQAVWTDGTYIYVISDSSNTTSRKWSISGATLNAVSTATVSSGLTATANGGICSIWDGTNAYLIMTSSDTDYSIKKLTAVDGTAYSTTTYFRGEFEAADLNPLMINIDATKIYVGVKSDVYNATVVDRTVLNLIPVTKP